MSQATKPGMCTKLDGLVKRGRGVAHDCYGTYPFKAAPLHW